MNHHLWPYLTPSRPGWWLIDGMRGHVRRKLSAAVLDQRRADDPLSAVLTMLGEVDQLIRALEKDTLLLVVEAHQRGASWAQIAARVYRTKQTIHQRYHRRMYASHTTDLLRRDYAEAVQRAGRYCSQGCPHEAAESHAFLRILRAHTADAVLHRRGVARI